MLALPTRAGDPAVTRGPVRRAGKCVRREGRKVHMHHHSEKYATVSTPSVVRILSSLITVSFVSSQRQYALCLPTPSWLSFSLTYSESTLNASMPSLGSTFSGRGPGAVGSGGTGTLLRAGNPVMGS